MAAARSVKLPEPYKKGAMSVEESIQTRRSHREYVLRSISLLQLSQILWAAQGITDIASGKRAAPSPGAKFTIELYAVVKQDGVQDLDAGIYHYEVNSHSLSLISEIDSTSSLQAAAGDQEQIGMAAVTIAITAFYERAMVRYGERGIQYAIQESGAVGENIYLETTALGLGTVMMGAFDEDKVAEILQARKGEKPLLLMSIGYPK